MAQPRGARPMPSVAGFTLLEVLIAVAILGMSLTSLLGSQMDSIRASRYARQLSAAAFLAEYQLVDIEWQMRKDGWQANDVEFDGDFDEFGWPEIEYACLVDFIEMPEYNELVNAKEDSDAASGDDSVYADAQDQTFSALGTVWPLIKNAIESSIRKSSCKVMWKNGAIDEEFEVYTFWTDPGAMLGMPSFGGETTDEDDDSSDGPGANPTTPQGGGGMRPGGMGGPPGGGGGLGMGGGR